MRQRTQFFISFSFLILFAPLCVLSDSNNISSLVFTTNPQTISAGAPSQIITVSTENAGAAVEKVSETNDVTFTSTSATGKFLNSSGGAVSTTMSTNTASRSFYYEDSTTGSYIITVTIKGRTSGKTFSATQNITITGGEQNSSSSDNTTASSTDDSNSDATTSDSSDISDAYSSQVDTYDGEIAEPFKVSIGRNRLVTVGEPVNFQARFIPSNTQLSGMNFHFAFGDGAEWNGLSATHTYEYPGDYIVVLDATRFGDEAVAEVKVKVVNADITISNSTDGSMKVQNNGADEINIGGWVVTDDIGRFLVPQDTIVAAHSFITIPAQVMKIKKFSGEVALYNPAAEKITSLKINSNTEIALPLGMTADEFEQKFSKEFISDLDVTKNLLK